MVEQQVARMLDDPKSKALSNNFAGQYLYLRNLASQKPDPDEFPEWDTNLRKSFEKETQMFFNAMLRENRPVTELIDGKFTFVNQRLAEFYGIPNVYGPQFRRVTLTDPNRGGILGQGSLSDGDLLSESYVGSAARKVGSGKSFGNTATSATSEHSVPRYAWEGRTSHHASGDGIASLKPGVRIVPFPDGPDRVLS